MGPVRRLAPSAALVALLAVGSGCVSSEAKQLVRDKAAASDADYRDFLAGKLTPGQVERKFFDQAASDAALNYSINGVPVPPQYAPPTSASTGK